MGVVEAIEVTSGPMDLRSFGDLMLAARANIAKQAAGRRLGVASNVTSEFTSTDNLGNKYLKRVVILKAEILS